MAITGFVHEYDHPASCFKPCDRDAGYHAHVMHVEKERGWMRRFDLIVARVKCGSNVYAMNCMETIAS